VHAKTTGKGFGGFSFSANMAVRPVSYNNNNNDVPPRWLTSSSDVPDVVLIERWYIRCTSSVPEEVENATMRKVVVMF
jgi:hypothetical protein